MYEITKTTLASNRTTIAVLLLLCVASVVALWMHQAQSTSASSANEAVNKITPKQTHSDDAGPALEESPAVVGGSSSTNSSSDASSSNKSSLTVNGQPIPLPDNGTVNQTLSDGNSTTTVNAQTRQNNESSDGGSSNSSHSSLNVSVHSNSSQEANN